MASTSPQLRVRLDGYSAEAPLPARAADDTATVMGLPFHRLDQGDLARIFLEGVRSGQGGWIVTPNLDILRQFNANPECRDLVLRASHRVADGQPIVWASRLAGTPLPERVPGSDLVLSIPEAAARAGLSLFLLGGNPGVATAAAQRLRSSLPGLRRVESYCPPFGYEDDPDELERIRTIIRRARPAIVLVGLGFPKQERLIRALRSELQRTWFVGVGISLSFLAGEQPRAPAVLQRLGLEWMHRLAHEPRRLFGRYVIQGIPFGLRLLGWALARRLSERVTDGAAEETNGYSLGRQGGETHEGPRASGPSPGEGNG